MLQSLSSYVLLTGRFQEVSDEKDETDDDQEPGRDEEDDGYKRCHEPFDEEEKDVKHITDPCSIVFFWRCFTCRGIPSLKSVPKGRI